MVGKEGYSSEFADSGSEPWNIARGYTTLKVLLPLEELDRLIKVALYGYDKIEDSFSLSPEQKVVNRVEALDRIINVLRMLIENAEFTIKKTDKDKFKSYEEDLNLVESVSGAILNKYYDARNRKEETKINEEHFKNCLTMLREIKKNINYQLDNANLIFPKGEEVDLEKIKDKITYGG